MTPTDTDRRLAEIVARQVTPTSIFVHAREDIAFLLSLVESLSRELLAARSVGAPLGAAPISAEGSIPSLPCPSTPTEERWVAFVSDDRVWVCASLTEARHTIEDELGTRTQEGDEWEGDEEEMWVGRVQITERVTEIYRGPDPSGRHDELVNYALRPVSTPFRTETK